MDGDKGLPGELLASDRFEYSYATDTRREIVENWLDLGWHRGNVRAGLTLNSQAPVECSTSKCPRRHSWTLRNTWVAWPSVKQWSDGVSRADASGNESLTVRRGGRGRRRHRRWPIRWSRISARS